MAAPIFTGKSEAVIGAKELQRAFDFAGTEMRRNIKQSIRGYAQPVARDASGIALSIGTGTSWSRMRVGSTPQMSYVAPVNRGTKILSRKRRNFAKRVIDRAMIPALERNAPRIVEQFNALVGRVERSFYRGG